MKAFLKEISEYFSASIVKMVDSTVDWYGSKKTKDMLYGSLLVAVMGYFQIDVLYVSAAAGIVFGKIGAQGLADIGKSKAEVESKKK